MISYWNKISHSRRLGLGALLPGFVGAFVLYFVYWDHSIGFMDSCDLTLAVYTLGIAHPTGYPLFASLGFLFHLIFPLNAAAGAALVSVLAGALAAGLVGILAARLIPQKADWMRLLAGTTAGLLIAVTPLLWSQAIRVEVYALNLVLVLLTLHLALPREGSHQSDIRPLLLMAFICGIGLNHHLSFATMIPLYLMLILPRLWRHPSWIAALAVFFLLGVSLTLFMPLRATTEPGANWLQVVRWDRFLREITGAQFRNKMLAMTPLRIELQFGDLVQLGLKQFPLWFWFTLPFGVVAARKCKVGLYSCLYIILMGIAVMLSYDIFDIGIYLIPALAAATVLIAIGVTLILGIVGGIIRVVLARLTSWAKAQTIAITVLTVLLLIATGWLFSSYYVGIEKTRNNAAFEYGSHILIYLPFGAFVQTSDANPSFIIKWLRYGEWMRPDLEHVDPNDQRVSLVQSARMALQAASAGRRAYVDYQTLGPDMPEFGVALRSRFSPAGLLASVTPTEDDQQTDALVLDWLKKEYVPSYRDDPEAIQAILQPLNERAVAFLLLKDYAQACKYADLCVLFAPDRPEVRVNRAGALLGLGRTEEAIQDLIYVTEVKPGQTEAWGKLGLTYYANGDKKAAQHAFERALALDGRSYDANYYLAQLYIDSGAVENGIKLLTNLAEMYPARYEPNLLLGRVLMIQNNFSSAVKYLEKAVLIHPHEPEAIFTLGECYLALGRLDSAEQQYRLVLNLNPGDKNARNRILEIMRQKRGLPQ